MATGKWYFYKNNGELEKEGEFINDLEEGEWIFYSGKKKGF